MSGLEIDHIFMFIQPGGPEVDRLEAQGWKPSYRRRHVGQGTANICYCLDNLFLELIWVVNPAEMESHPVKPTGLLQRSFWRERDGSPFGIALRLPKGKPVPFEAWGYGAPFLPEGMSIPIASFSQWLHLPFVFIGPGGTRPDQWSDGRAGSRQREAGLGEVTSVRLTLPSGCKSDPELERLATLGVFELQRSGHAHELALDIADGDGFPECRLILPQMRFEF